MTNRARSGKRMTPLGRALALTMLGLSAAVAEAGGEKTVVVERPSKGVAHGVLAPDVPQTVPTTNKKSTAIQTTRTPTPAATSPTPKTVPTLAESVNTPGKATSVKAPEKKTPSARAKGLSSTDYGVPPALRNLPKPVIRQVKRAKTKRRTNAAPASTTRRGAHVIHNAARTNRVYRSGYEPVPKTPSVIYANPPPPAHILIQYECFT